MNLRELINTRRIILDGAMGTCLQAAGLKPGELPELWNITHPEEIAKVHRAYFDAGSNIICTNTFGANSIKFNDKSGNGDLKEIVRSALGIAKKERDDAKERFSRECFVALDIGPLGRMLKPFGDLDFEDAVDIFAKTVRLGAEFGADLIYFETFTDTYELKAAILAAKENCDLPIFATCAFDANGQLMTGGDAYAVAAMLEGLGVDALGANCGVGPDLMAGVIEKMVSVSSVPVIAKPNAGLPKSVYGKTVFELESKAFAEQNAVLARLGASLIGGCCGTTPAHLSESVKSVASVPFKSIEKKHNTVVSSYSHAVEIGKTPVLIGERINPTGKKAFKEALHNRDISYILAQGSEQAKAGAHILDVNVGLPEIDECAMMKDAVCALQSVLDLPLQIDTSDVRAMETALRYYNGKPLVNSVNGKAESLARVLPLVKKYGGAVVGLTLDENGIPENAQGRADIAGRIIEAAEKYGVEKKNIIIDPLTLTVATDAGAARVTLEAMKLIRRTYGVNCCLGVSNVSFGLPERDRINSVFFTMALENGLMAAIMNPMSELMMNSYRSYLALNGMDEGQSAYIAYASQTQSTIVRCAETGDTSVKCDINSLKGAIVSGLRERASELTRTELERRNPMRIIDEVLVPALSEVGEAFAQKKLFLPQLLMSAEAAGAAFDIIRSSMPESDGKKKGKILLATVKGDIHDIGKNIVKALLENYNYEVIDLGRDVPAENIIKTAQCEGVGLVGLSALMTTTVPAMEETIALLKKALPNVKIMVGGAVLTQEYADKIGADHYSPDAMDGVRYAEMLFQ